MSLASIPPSTLGHVTSGWTCTSTPDRSAPRPLHKSFGPGDYTPRWTHRTRKHNFTTYSSNPRLDDLRVPDRPEVDPAGVRLLVIGGKQVGKSALAVRYLTKKYIGEYQSHSDLHYRQKIQLEDGRSLQVEIIDVSDRPGDDPARIPLPSLRSCDAVVVMYSITDRASFQAADRALHFINKEEVKTPVLLLANKIDLGHVRKVSTSEGSDLADRYHCTSFHEVSVADSPIECITILNKIVRDLWTSKTDVAESSDALHRPRPSSPSRSTPPTGSTSTPPPGTPRKISHVFNVSRVFNSLMGRNSMPPELPSSHQRHLSTSGVDARTALKKVFKKRSV